MTTGPECKVCTDSRISAIHAALDGKASERKVASSFGIPRTTLQRHIAHRANPPTTSPALVVAARGPAPIPPKAPPSSPALVEVPGARPETLQEAQEKIRALAEEALRLVQESGAGDTAGTYRERAAVLTAAKNVLELLAKVLGELGPDVEIRVLQLPAWQEVQRVTLEALEPYPEALEAVASAWKRLAA